jgi:hypothetical protein
MRGYLLALAAAAGVYVVYAAAGLNESERVSWIFDNWVYYGVLLGAAGACFARGFHDEAPRAPWLALGIAIAAWATGDLYWVFFLRDDGDQVVMRLQQQFNALQITISSGVRLMAGVDLVAEAVLGGRHVEPPAVSGVSRSGPSRGGAMM